MLFRQEVIEGQSQSGMGDVIISQPRIFAVMTTAFVVIAFVFAGIAAYGTYSRKETVPGYLAPQNGVAPIFAQRGGIVTEIFVAEGDRVVAGDPIVRLSLDSANAEDDASLAAQIARVDARIREARLQLEARSQLFGGEEAELALRIEGLEADLDQLSRSADLARESAALAERQWERWQSLSERGLAPNAEVERVRNSLINAQGVLQDIARQRLERERQLSEVRHQVTQLPTRRDLELSRARDSVTALEQARRDLERAAGYTISAPIAGRVTSVQASIGLAVRPELPLAALVPEGAGPPPGADQRGGIRRTRPGRPVADRCVQLPAFWNGGGPRGRPFNLGPVSERARRADLRPGTGLSAQRGSRPAECLGLWLLPAAPARHDAKRRCDRGRTSAVAMGNGPGASGAKLAKLRMSSRLQFRPRRLSALRNELTTCARRKPACP